MDLCGKKARLAWVQILSRNVQNNGRFVNPELPGQKVHREADAQVKTLSQKVS